MSCNRLFEFLKMINLLREVVIILKRSSSKTWLLLLFFVIAISISGCSHQPVSNQNSQTPTVTKSSSVEEKIHIINNLEDAGPGPLTEENVWIGGVHLGNSQQQILRLYGEPSKKTALLGNDPSPEWQYEKLGLSILFTLDSKIVYSIDISSPSNLRTNTGIGIGSSLEDIVRIYGDQVYGYKPNQRLNNQFIVITGTKQPTWATYPYPSLSITLQNGLVNDIGLYTPNP